MFEIALMRITIGVGHKWRHKGGGGQIICESNTKASIMKSVTMGEGGQKMFKIARRHFWTAPNLAYNL